MKIGLRTPSLKKSISARTSGRLTRSVKKLFIPFYGKKGTGLIKNPKKALYNKVYHKTTFGVSDTLRVKSPAKKKAASKTTIQSSKKAMPQKDVQSVKDKGRKNTLIGAAVVGSIVIGTVIYANSPKYSLTIDDQQEFPCNASYDESTGDISCEEQTFTGLYTPEDNAILESSEPDGFTYSSGHIAQKMPVVKISASDYQKETYSETLLLAKFSSTPKTVTITLADEKKTKQKTIVQVKTSFSDADLALIKEKYDIWREQKGSETESNANPSSTPTQSATPSSSSASSAPTSPSNSSGYSSNTQEEVSGYCKDGTPVTGVPSARGKANSCYGHGGWQDQY